jgi:hypothetical protein
LELLFDISSNIFLPLIQKCQFFPLKNNARTYAARVFELYLTFDFSKFRRNRRGLYKRLQNDNYF